MNWEKTRDNRNEEIEVTMTMKRFKELEPKIELADQINSLNGSAKEVVLQLLEELLKSQEE